MSKKTQTIIAVSCFILAGVVVYSMTGSEKGTASQIPSDELLLVKCRACDEIYETNKKEFFEYILAHQKPNSMQRPMPPCKECGKEALQEAIKCGQCGNVFYPRGAGILKDKCPSCGFSEIEERRKNR